MGERIPTAALPQRGTSAVGGRCDVYDTLRSKPEREPARIEQVTIAIPRVKGWRYRWRFEDGTFSAWKDAPIDRSFILMPPAACGMDVEQPRSGQVSKGKRLPLATPVPDHKDGASS